MKKILAGVVVLVAVGVGGYLVLRDDDDGSERRELTRVQVERLLQEPGAFAQRSPDSVQCERASRSEYKCKLLYKGEAVSGYDLRVSAYELPPAEREAQLVRAVRAGYRRQCRMRTPRVTVDCDHEAGRCRYWAGDSSGQVGYNEPLRYLIC
jgi:hypothetical protein